MGIKHIPNPPKNSKVQTRLKKTLKTIENYKNKKTNPLTLQ